MLEIPLKVLEFLLPLFIFFAYFV